MLERRSETRLLCADLVEIVWKDRSGRSRRTMANLEDISGSGACLQLESAIPVHTQVTMTYGSGQLAGHVRYCVYREIGYFLGIKFADGVKWKRRQYRPQHLFDPRRMAG